MEDFGPNQSHRISKRSEMAEQRLAKLSDINQSRDNIMAENLVLKSKLDSKCEALIILSKEVTSLRNDNQSLKQSMEELGRKSLNRIESESFALDSRNHRTEIETLRQKLRDAEGDIQALRRRLSHNQCLHESCDMNSSQREEDLIERFEKVQRDKLQLETDLQSVLDEKEELISERDAYKCKLHRLNYECNILLKGTGNGIIDLDSLVMENRLLQEKLIQAQEEQQLAKQVSERYKSILQSKKKGSCMAGGVENASGLLLSQRQVKELLESCGRTDIPNSETSFSDLRSLCLALLDSLGDKTLALTHQKRANRILAARIAELQTRLESMQRNEAVSSPSKALLDGYRSYSDLNSSTNEGADSENSADTTNQKRFIHNK